MSSRRTLIERFQSQLAGRNAASEVQDLMAHTVVLLLLAVFYGYFSLAIDGDPDHCWGPNSSTETQFVEEQQVRIEGEEGYEDVGAQFRACFDLLFYTTCAQLAAFSAKTLTDQKASATKTSKARFWLLALTLVFFAGRGVALVTLAFALGFRFRHPSQVCCGDFLDASDSPKGYLVEQGFFLELHVYVLAALALSLLLCGCFQMCVRRNRATY